MARVSIKESVGEALRFVRAQWRFAAMVGAIGALLLSVASFLGPLALIVLPATLIACHTALVSAALRGPGEVRARLASDSLRVGGAMLIVGLIVVILVIATAYIAMAVLIAPYAEQARAAGDDQAQIEAVMRTAVAAQPHIAPWALAIGGTVIFFFTSRLFLAAPGSADSGRITALDSWRWTRGATLAVMGARLLLLGPVLILVGALQSLLGAMLGFNVSDPSVLMAQAAANPVLFKLFFAGAAFLHLTLFGAHEAGLSAALYRRLSPPAA